MVESLDWGTLSTLSTMNHVSGSPFGNPVSFASNHGVPYMCVSPLDQSIQDLFADARVSLSMSEAQFGNYSSCLIPSGDPENPPCARLSISGVFENVTDPNEWQIAKQVLTAKHPSFENFCFSSDDSFHHFFLAKINIYQVWLINMYGGASFITPSQYYNVTKNQEESNLSSSSSSTLIIN
mmetsp:Transcript_7898/g.11012  ORF Transcript_7898/g.11012 Transcript_7898/m.11012 type:complete len:181 (+) Transcript_7898:1-543(+)